MSNKQASLADALQHFLADDVYKNIDIDSAVFEGLRVESSGRDIQL